MKFFKKTERRPFRLSYGVPIPDHKAAGITEWFMEGYQVVPETNSPYPWAMTIMASSERIWQTVLELAEFVGPDCMAVLEVHREDVVTTYTSTGYSKERVLEVFGQYAFQLVHDGFTAFGLASPAVEVFVRAHKEIHIDCQQIREIERKLDDLGYERKRQLSLLGTGPHYHADLGAFFGSLAYVAEPIPDAEIRKFVTSRSQYNGFRDSVIRQLEMTVQRRVHN